MPKKKALPVGKELALLFFKESKDEDHIWLCRECGHSRKVNVKKCGYSNLVSHINGAHRDDIEKRFAIQESGGSFSSVLWPRKTKQIHAWM